jgi:isopenicillin-N N-acyltransferase like protein
MSLPTVTLHGTPFERGLQHGAQFRPEIGAAAAELESVPGESGYRRAAALALAAWPDIQAQAPTAAAELEGIAAGARLALIDALLLSGFEFFDCPGAVGCSAIAAAGRSGALVAQNWDAAPSAAAGLVLFLHFGQDGFERAVIGSTGCLGWVGCNRHGLAFVNNDLVLSSTGPGLPSQIVRRLILEEPSVAAATDRLQAIRHMAGRSYLLGDATGAVAGVEVSAARGASVNQTVSPVLHANHALDPKIAADEAESALEATYPSSRHRQSVLQRKAPQPATIRSIAALLSDTEGHPDAVAKTASAREPTATLFSVIFDCGVPALHLCAGTPTVDSFERMTW